MCIQDPPKHLGWNSLQQQLTTYTCQTLLQSIPFQMFTRVLNTPLQYYYGSFDGKFEHILWNPCIQLLIIKSRQLKLSSSTKNQKIQVYMNNIPLWSSFYHQQNGAHKMTPSSEVNENTSELCQILSRSWLVAHIKQLIETRKRHELILAVFLIFFVWNFREITAATHDNRANKNQH